jgi:glucan 1,3-beta-glucosidase
LGAIKWRISASNIARTNAIIKTLAAEFSKSKYASVVTAIAPLNEPAGWVGDAMLSKTKQFWLDSYGNVRYPFGTSTQGDLIEIIDDAFMSLDCWNGWQPYPKYTGVMMDVHNYQVFVADQLKMNVDQHAQVRRFIPNVTEEFR